MEFDSDNSARTKTCTKCGETKDIAAFHKVSGGAKARAACIECANELARQRYQRDLEKSRERSRLSREKDPEKARQLTAAWYYRNKEAVAAKSAEDRAANPEKYAERNREYRTKNRAKENKRQREWRAKNPEKAAAILAKWIEGNPEKLKEIQRASSAKRRATPKGKLDTFMSTGIHKALKGGKAGRSWEKLVGYTVSQLSTHLEEHFLPGMTWANHGRGDGKWHIDHIIPRSAFNYETSDDIDFKRCWALENLQPLWEFANLSKGAKLDKPFQPSLAISA